MITLVTVSPPEFVHAPPLGILYVGGALKKAGYDVEVLHFPPGDIQKYARQIASKNPSFIGISVFTCNQTKFSAQLSRAIKESCDSPIVWGGVHPSMVQEQTLGESYVDAVVIGEGEETAVELADAYEKKKDLKDVKGIGYKKNGELVFTEPRSLIKNLDDYKLDWDLVDVKKYLVSAWGRKRVINFISSRGCPYKCGFCYNLKFNKGRWRGHSKEFIITEVQKLKEQYGVDGIVFYDDNFFANKKRAIEIVEALDLPWEGELRIGYITDELARKLKDTKCQGITFGMESGNDRILELIHKDQSVDDITRGISILAKYPEVRVSGCVILANPTETREEIRNTINQCLKLWKIHPRVVFSIGTFLPYPGVPLYELVTKAGYVPPNRTEDWELLNRSNINLEVAWLPWVTERDRKDFLYAGRYVQLLPLGNLRIPVLNKIVYWRLSHYNFTLPIELGPLTWIHKKFADRSSKLSRAMRKLLPYLGSRGRTVKN